MTDEGRSMYIGSFCPAMTSLSRPTGQKHRPTGQKQPTVRWKDGGK